MNEGTTTVNSTLVYNPQFDGLRFFAAMVVVSYHWLPFVHNTANDLQLGGAITFFFVLSSYLITRILFNAKQRNISQGIPRSTLYGVFMLRRTIRIFPAYYCFLLVTLLFPSLGNDVRQSPLAYFAYFSNYHIFNEQHYPPAFGHTWTLAVEEQFYLLWPLIIFWVPKRYLPKVFLAIIILSAILRGFFFKPGLAVPQAILTQYSVDAFAIGGLLAYMQFIPEKEKHGIRRIVNLSLILMVPLTVWSIWVKDELFVNLTTRLTFPLISMLLIEKAIKGYKGINKWILENKAVIYIGRISYGVYLYHLIAPAVFWKIYDLFRRFFVHVLPGFYEKNHEAIWAFEKWLASSYGICALLYLATVVAMASLSAFLLELPLSKFKIQYPGQKQAVPKEAG